MIAVDTSSIVCVAKREPNYQTHLAILTTAECVIGAPTVHECHMVLSSDRITRSARFLDDLLRLPNVSVVAFGSRRLAIAREAFTRFGKGGGSGVGLNFGDCLSYAIAKADDALLLHMGDDFRRTDLRLALP